MEHIVNCSVNISILNETFFYFVLIEVYLLGEVQDVQSEIVVTKKGIVDKDKFYLPKMLVERYDGHKVFFSITKEDAPRTTEKIHFNII